MSKKLLSEAQMRRFAKLANINPINETYNMHARDEEMNEEVVEEVAMDAEEEAPAEMDAEIEDEAGEDDLSGREEMARDVIAAVADALNIEVDIDGGEEEMKMDDEPMADEPMADAPMADEEELMEEDELSEALSGITYVPGREEIVNEVAKRVAKRLVEAKKAQAKLQEALGGRRRTQK